MRRFQIPWRPVLESVVTIFIGLIAGALLMIPFGYKPLDAYYALFKGAFGTVEDVLETLAFATPLMLTAITFAIGVKTGLFNIGAEGQMYMGAIGAVAVAGLIHLPPGIHVALATLAAMLAGALWALPAALLKIWRGVHEVISTIMFNWIAFHLSMYLAIYYLAEPGRAERTVPALPTARYPVFMEGSSITAVIFVAVAFCIFVYFYLWGTKAGYELRLAGENPDAARYGGVNAQKVLIMSFLIGGLAAGLAGASQIIGRPPAWSLYATLGNISGLGFDGIGIALIGRNHPLGGILAAILYGALQHGGRFMEYHAGVNSELVRAINGLIIIALAVPEIGAIIRRRLKR
ncbi:MAG: ABC transporter permease [Chloroflexi bacterium]|nr:MAG: ABC transporter permease [Chloroflexota bacterium]HDN80666.1 ABC transporter permease [Chloroflexota bacterium]